MCNIHLTHIYNFFYELFEGRVQTWCCPFAPKYFSVCFLKAKTFSSMTKYNDHNRQFTSVQSNYLIYFLQILPVVPWIFSMAKQNKMFLVRFMLFRVMFLWIPSIWNDCSSFSNSGQQRDLMIGLRWCVVGRHTREAVLVLRAPTQEAHLDLTWLRWCRRSSCFSLAITKYLVEIHSETVQNILFLSLGLPSSFSIQWDFLLEIIITMWVAKWWIHQPHFLMHLFRVYLFFSIFFLLW